MRARLPILAAALALLGCASSYSQAKPRIAVIPFNALSVSEADAEVVTGLVETALVKTESYEVIEQREMDSILEAQEYAIADCTDERCAVEFGKLLAAEQIVLGSFSSIGGTYVLNARVIDVAQGKNIKADTVEVARLENVTEATELLAFKLAGLTYSRGEEVQVARQFGEVFVETDPPGADIYVNGVRKGKSPDLLARIPLGRIIVEARLGALFAVQEIEVTAKTGVIKLTLEEQYGNLFIKSPTSEVTVVLDGKELGPLGSGFFLDLPAGEHTVELKGHGLAWSGTALIRSGESTRVEAHPREFGMLEYSVPDGATAEITSAGYRQVVHGTGRLEPLWIGSYMVLVSGDRFEPQTLQVVVERGKTSRLDASPSLTPAALRTAFEEAIRLSEIGLEPGEEVTREQLAGIETLRNEIRQAGQAFLDLDSRVVVLLLTGRRRVDRQESETRALEEARVLEDRIAELRAQLALLQEQIELHGRRRTSLGRAALVFLAVSAGSAAGAVACRTGATSAYLAYGTAQTTGEAVRLRGQTQTLDGFFVTLTVGSVLSLGGSLISYGLRPSSATLQEEFRRVEAELEALE